MDAIFISDLHLDDARPDLTEGFTLFCDTWGERAGALYILGDLFEVWIGDDQATATARAVKQSLAKLADRGTRIHIGLGNRDFLLGEQFARECKARLLQGPSVETIGNQRILVAHGDEWCLDDIEYQNFRKMVRDPRWMTAFLQRPIEMRMQMAVGLRKESQAQGQAKDYAIMDVTSGAVENAFVSHDVKAMIHGHVHRPAVHRHTIHNRTAKRYVLGDWSDTGWMVTMDGAAINLLNFPLTNPSQVRHCGT